MTAIPTDLPFDTPDRPLRLGLRGPVTLGAIGALALIGGLGGWAATARIGGAVVSGGEVVAAGHAQQVQSLDGGVVREIAVANGDRVAAGDLLVTLDDTLVRTNLGIAEARLAEALTLEARLAAEEQGLDAPVFAWPDLPVPVPDTARQEEAQLRLFAARAELAAGGRDRLAERLAEGRTRRSGLDAQIAAAGDQVQSLRADRDTLATLVDQGLARAADLSELERRIAETVAREASLVAERDGLAATMRDAEIETLQAERTRAEEAGRDRRDAAARIDELVLEIVTRRSELARMELRAPVAGIVHDVQVATRGGVVAPGSTLLQILPSDGGLAFELRLDPRAVDQVHVGQAGEVMFAGLDPTAVPKLSATVSQVSAATVPDPRTGTSYYRVTLSLPPAELDRLGEVELLPGMPIQAYLGTGERTVLDYLLHPITTHLGRALREP